MSSKMTLLLGYTHGGRSYIAVKRALVFLRNGHGVLGLCGGINSLFCRRHRWSREVHLCGLFFVRSGRLSLLGRALALLLFLLMLALIQPYLVVVPALRPYLPLLPHGLFVGVKPKPSLLEDTVDLVLQDNRQRKQKEKKSSLG